MKQFKSYLLEYLTQPQRESFKHTHMTPEARSATDHFFGKDNDKVTSSLSGSDHQHDKSEIHKQIEHHLGKEISHEDYRAGKAKDHLDRETRIGKLIKDKSLRDSFATDTTREGSRKGNNFSTSTHRGIEVAGQTNSAKTPEHPNGHSWGEQSCKNVDTGGNNHYLPHEIEHGTVVHFVHDHSGKEIYRATLHPHIAESGHRAYAVESEYGIKHPAFTNSAHETAKKLSQPDGPKDVLYHKHKDVYNDSGNKIALHPAADSEHIHNLVSGAKIYDKKDIYSAALNSHSIHPKTLRHIAENSNDDEKISIAANHKNADESVWNVAHEKAPRNRNIYKSPHAPTDKLIHTLENTSDHHLVSAIASNPKIPLESIEKAVNNKSAPIDVRATATHRDGLHPSHIHNVIKDAVEKDSGSAVFNAVHENGNLKTHDLNKALDDHGHKVKQLLSAALYHKNADSSTHKRIFSHVDEPENIFASGSVGDNEHRMKSLAHGFISHLDDLKANPEEHAKKLNSGLKGLKKYHADKISEEHVAALHKHAELHPDNGGIHSKLHDLKNISTETIGKMVDNHIKHGHPITDSLVMHKNFSAGHISKLIDHPNTKIDKESLTMSRNFNHEHLDKIGGKNVSVLAKQMLSRFSSDHNILRTIYHSSDSARKSVQRNRNIPSDLISHTIENGEHKNLYGDIPKAHIEPKHVKHLIKKAENLHDASSIVNAGGDLVSKHDITKLLMLPKTGSSHEDEHHIRELAKHPKIDKSHIDQIAKTHGVDTMVRAGLHKHDDFNDGHFNKVLDEGSSRSVNDILEKGSHLRRVKPATVVKALEKDRHATIRSPVMGHVANILHKHVDPNVRLAVVKSEHTPLAIKEKMVNDTDKTVANYAQDEVSWRK